MLALFLILVVIALAMVLFGLLSGTGGMEAVSVGGDRIALIRVDGMIAAGQSGYSPFSGAVTGSDDVVSQLERAEDDGSVRGVLLRVNSPGGSAAGCQEIYQAIERLQGRGKIVVVSMADVAASGGYYVSAPAKEIWADPATITGSIGVIAMHEDISGLFSKIGVKTEVLKAGKLKDMMSPYRPLDAESRALMERLLRETHEQFIEAVVKGRSTHGLSEEMVRKLADGRIYSGAQAQENGLVDKVGGMQDALAAAARLAGIPGRPRTKEYRAPGLLRWLLGGSSAGKSAPVTVTGGLLYDPVAERVVRGALDPRVPPGEM